MRFAPIFAAVLAFAGIASATPAAASTALTKSVPVAASINADPTAGTTADQYRDRRGAGGAIADGAVIVAGAATAAIIVAAITAPIAIIARIAAGAVAARCAAIATVIAAAIGCIEGG